MYTWLSVLIICVFQMGAGVSEAAERAPLVLSHASADELAKLESIELPLAQSIVALRTERKGVLTSVEELRILPDMTPTALQSLRDHTAIEVEVPVRSTGAGGGLNTVEDVLKHFDNEPSIQVVQQMALEYARTSPQMVQRWMRDSRTFAALPQLTLEYRLRDGWDQDFQYYAADGVVDIPDEQVFDVLDDAGHDQDAYYTVRARWDLDQLVLSSERIRLINEIQDVVKLRDTVLREVTTLYFQRRRLQAELLMSPKLDIGEQVRDTLRMMELTANVDALTGGGFSQRAAISSNQK
jgi:hypothetical protein